MNHIFLIMLILSWSVSFDTPVLLPAPTQKIYCEKSYINFAWGYQHQGVFVDPEGNLYSFNYARKDQRWNPKQEQAPTAEELEEKYSHGKTFISKIETTKWQENSALVLAAKDGKLSPRVQKGADQGAQVCRCYLFNEAEKHYKEVELQVRGDWNYENLAPSAKTLVAWLTSLPVSAEKK